MKRQILRKIITTTIACVMMMTTLTACGGGKGNVKTAKEPVPASKAFNQEGVWFYIGEDEKVGKDENIGSILVFDGKGNVTSYDCSELSFSDLKELSDDEIISLAEEQDKLSFESTISQIEENLNTGKTNTYETIDAITNEMNEAKAEQPDKASEIEEFYNSEINDLQEVIGDADSFLESLSSIKYKEPEAAPYTIHIETDHTGNATQTEYITFNTNVFQSYGLRTGGGGYKQDDLTWSSQENKVKIFPDYGTQMVYDMNFRGFATMVTLVSEDHAGFMMDTPDTKGIEVD